MDGSFTAPIAYDTNRGHDSIAMFTRDTDSGALTPNGIEPSRAEMPQNLTITPAGKLLFLVSTTGNFVVAFTSTRPPVSSS